MATIKEQFDKLIKAIMRNNDKPVVIACSREGMGFLEAQYEKLTAPRYITCTDPVNEREHNFTFIKREDEPLTIAGHPVAVTLKPDAHSEPTHFMLFELVPCMFSE